MAAGQPYHHRGDPTSPYNRSSFRSSTPARNGRDPDPLDTASAHPLPRRRPLLRPNPASSPIPTPANARRRCSGHRTTSRIRISAPPPVPRRRRLEDAGTPPRRRTRRRIHAVAASRCPDVRPEISRSSDPRYPLLRHHPSVNRAAASAPVHHPIGLLVELNGKGGGISTSYYTKTNFPIEGTPYVSRQLEGQSDSLSDPRPRLGGPRLGHLFLVASEMDPNEVYSIQGFGADAKLMYEARQVANDAVSSIRTVASFSAEEKVRKC